MSHEGHAHARTVVMEFLRARVPGYLELVRDRAGVDSPTDPKAESYLLADELPADASAYPCIVVRSTDATPGAAYEAQAAGEHAEREFAYAVEVIVATARREFSRPQTNDAPSVQSSLDRDRLSLAVRWALMAPGDFDESTRLASGIREENGPAQQLLDGKRAAAGTLTFQVVVVEEIPVLDPAQPIASHALAVDASLT